MAAFVQGFLFVVFLGAALTKLAGRDEFLRTLAAIPWLRLSLARVAAGVVPALELAVAGLIVVLPVVGGAAALVALGVFTAVVGHEIAAGRDLRCGCFGGTNGRSAGRKTVLRNGLLAAAALGAIALPHSYAPEALLAGFGLGLLLLLLEVGADTIDAARGA